MIRILQVRNIDSFVESRRQKTSEKDRKTVQAILNDVRKNGDSAVKKYERKFNGRKTSQLRVSAKEIKETRSKIRMLEEVALGRINLLGEQRLRQYLKDWGKGGKKFIISGKQTTRSDFEKSSSGATVTRRRRFIAISSVGCYIPGGQAKYPSSAIMSITPAKLAGVKRIVAVSPPGPDGKIDPLTIAAAKWCGATEITRLVAHKQLAHWHMEQNPFPKLIKLSDQEENLSVLQNHS